MPTLVVSDEEFKVLTRVRESPRGCVALCLFKDGLLDTAKALEACGLIVKGEPISASGQVSHTLIAYFTTSAGESIPVATPFTHPSLET